MSAPASPEGGHGDALAGPTAPVLTSVSYDGETVSVNADAVTGANQYLATFVNGATTETWTSLTLPLTYPLSVAAGDTCTVTLTAQTVTQAGTTSGPASAPRTLITTPVPAFTWVALSEENLDQVSAGWPAVEGAEMYAFTLFNGWYADWSYTVSTASTSVSYTAPVQITGSSWRVLVAVTSADGVVSGPPSPTYFLDTAGPMVFSMEYRRGTLVVLMVAFGSEVTATWSWSDWMFPSKSVQVTMPPGSGARKVGFPMELPGRRYYITFALSGNFRGRPSPKQVFDVPYATAVDNAAFWPMYQQNGARRGVAGAVTPEAFTLAFSAPTATALTGTVAIDSSGDLYAIDATADGNLYVIGPDDQALWSLATGEQLTCGGPLIEPDGTVYVAGTSLIAVTPGATSGTVAFTLPLGTDLVCSGPLAISPDAATLYVMATSTAAGSPSSLVAVKLPALPSQSPSIAWTTALAVDGTATTSSSGPAVAPDGTLYVGDDSGNLYSVSPGGALSFLQSFGTLPLSTPLVLADGSVHVMAVDSAGTGSSLNALSGTTTYRFSPTGATLGANPATAPCAAGSTVYAGFDTLYALTWSAGYTLAWQGSTSDQGVQPGPVVCDAEGTAVFCGADGYVAAYSPGGTLLWTTALATGGGSPALNAAGAVVYIDGASVNVGASWEVETLTTIYDGLEGEGAAFTLDATTVPAEAVLGLVAGALGVEAPYDFTDASVSWDKTTLTVSGTTAFLSSSTTAAVELSFSGTQYEQDAVILLDATITLPSADLADLLPLAGTLFDGLTITNAVFSQNSSTGRGAAEWTLGGSVTLAGPLANAATLLGLATTTVATVSGTVRLDVVPVINLTLSTGSPFTLPLSSGWSVTPALSLVTTYDEQRGLFTWQVILSFTTTIGGETVTLAASVPTSWGSTAFLATLDPPLTLDSVADMVWWSGGSGSALTAALPPGVAALTSFGLHEARMLISPAGAVAEIGLVFTAGDFSLSSAGLAFALTDVSVVLSVSRPLSSQPGYGVAVSGRVAFGSMTFDVTVMGPDWEIFGQGSGSITPSAALAALGCATALPASAPTATVTGMSFTAAPKLGTYEFIFATEESWTLFTAGNLPVSVEDFMFSVLATPTTRAGTTTGVTLTVMGELAIGGTTLSMGGAVSSGGGATLTGSLAGGGTSSSITDLIDAVTDQDGSYLPPALRQLGSSVALEQVVAVLAPGSGTSSVTIGVGTLPSWTGWSLVTTPFSCTLTQAAVVLTATTASSGNLTANVVGTLSFGTSTTTGVTVSLPLPFSSGSMVFSLAPGGTVPLPTVGELVGALSASWASALPAAVGALGSGIVLTQFQLTVTTSPASAAVSFALQSANPNAAWTPVPGFTLSRLTLAGSYGASGTQLAIGGVLLLGSAAQIPLMATMSGGLSTYTLQIPAGASVTAPSLFSLISAFGTHWGGALPYSIGVLQVTLSAFSLSVSPSGTSASATVSSPAAFDFSFAGFSVLTVSTLSGTLAYGGTANPAFSGTLGLAGTLFGQPMTLSATAPSATFTATVTLPSTFNLQTLLEQVFGDDADVPDWLAELGLQQLSVSMAPSKSTFQVTGVLPSPIDLGTFGGSLTGARLSIGYAAGAPTISVSAVWDPPVGPTLSGTLTYPFDLSDFVPNHVPLPGIDNFPPTAAPTLGTPSASVVDELVDLVGTLVTAPPDIATELADAGGGAGPPSDLDLVNDLSLTFLYAQYQDGVNATGCAAVGIEYFGGAPTSQQLGDVIGALVESFELDVDGVTSAINDAVSTFDLQAISATAITAAIALAHPQPSAG